MQTSYERDIDFLDIIWELFIQWKPLVLCGAVGAIAVVIAFNYKGMKTYQTADISVEARMDEVRASLTDSEIAAVEGVMLDREMMDEAQTTLNTIYDKGLDMDELPYVDIRYSISTDGIPVSAVAGIYDDKVVSGSLRQQIYNQLDGYDDDLDNVIPVVNVTYPLTDVAEYCIFVVSIPMLEGTRIEQIENLVRPYVEMTIYDEVNEYIPHGLSHLYTTETISPYTVPIAAVDRVSSQMSDTVNMITAGNVFPYTTTTTITTMSGLMDSLKQQVMAYRKSIATSEGAFKDGQKELYNYLLTEKEGSDATSYVLPIDTPSNSESSPLKLKYLAIGFMAGCFLYSVALALLYMLKGNVRTLGEVVNCYVIRGLDEVHLRERETALKKFLYSGRIYAMRYRKEEKDAVAHASDAARHAMELASHNELRHVTVVPTYEGAMSTEPSKQYLDGLSSAWDSSGIPMDIADAWTTEETRDDPGEKEGLVLLLKTGDTAFKTLDRIASYCRDYSVSVIGAVLLEG